MRNPVLERLRRGETLGSLWAVSGSVAVAEMMARARPDAMVFDIQHGMWDTASLFAAIGATREFAVPLARVMDQSPSSIGSALDAGAMGVIVPLVETAEQAAAVVAAAKYPPAGNRSGGAVRPLMDMKTYMAQANDHVMVSVMIETARGVENAAAIAAVPGIDMVFIGTGDLALSIGTFPDFGPRHEEAVQRVLAACRAAGTAPGVFAPHHMLAADRRRQGFRFMAIGDEVTFLKSAAASAVKEFAPAQPERAVDLTRGAALVTGTNRGIGKAIVEALLAAGMPKVYAASRAGTAPIKDARVVPLALDITDDAAVERAVATCADATVVINNAGINFNTALLGAPIDHARREVETNYLGTLGMCRAFAPVLKANGGGAVVNLLSILARGNLPMMGSLCASKAASYSMTQGLRAQLGAQGTLVVAVLPGAVDTDMTRDFKGDKIPPTVVAGAIVHALQTGIEDVYPGEMAAGVATGLALDPKGTERELAKFLPEAG